MNTMKLATKCTRKFFATKREAKHNKNAYEDKFWKKITVYKCLYCPWYHFTTKSSVEEKQKYRKLKSN
jgi:hypothetical protein